jgi:cytochrome c biogenesis protein CcmG/thiol:disulfide interchange protein DsbE
MPAIAVALVLALLWKSLLFKDQPMAKESTEQALPHFSLMEVKTKKTLTNDDLLGKPHVLHVWASWCGPCVKENPILLQLKEKWPVSIVGVLYKDDPAKAEKLLDKKGNPFTHLLNDKSGKFAQHLKIQGTPETFVIDAEGKIRFHHSGAMTMETVNTQLIPLLEQIAHEKSN